MKTVKNIGTMSLTITNNGNGDVTISPDDIISVDDETADYLLFYKAYDENGGVVEFVEN